MKSEQSLPQVLKISQFTRHLRVREDQILQPFVLQTFEVACDGCGSEVELSELSRFLKIQQVTGDFGAVQI